jgi:hypothetical protein
MNAKRRAGFTVGTGIVAAIAGLALVAGCSAAPDGSDVAQSGEALGGTTNSCSTHTLDPNDPFESGLIALRCTGARAFSGGDGTAYFTVVCLPATPISHWCPATQTWEVVNAPELAACYANTDPYYASTSQTNPCTGRYDGEVHVQFDPTCVGGRCGAQ